MKSEGYWKKRAALRMYGYQAKADEVADDIAKSYIEATNYINGEIKSIFRTFQINGGLSESEAKELLNNLPDKITLDNLKEIFKQVKDPEKRQALLNQINAPAYAFRIKRFEQLQKDIDEQTEKLAVFEQKAGRVHYVDLAHEAYNRVVFDIQKGMGIGFSFAQMPTSRINEILNHNWSGKLFSERIWGRTEELNQTIKRELLTQFMTGRSYQKTAKEIEERMAVGAMEARRLVRTESTYIANSAEIESYKECGIEKFKFLATLDMRTSDLCRRMDGKEFEVDDASFGTNVPPLHPWCRSTTIAVIDGAVTEGLKRSARDPETGESYTIPSDMTYNQWKADYVDTEGERHSKDDYKDIGRTKVFWDGIYSKKWSENFGGITDNPTVNNKIRKIAVQMLKHRDGTFYEDMYLVNATTGKIEGFNTMCRIKQKIDLNDSLKNALNNPDIELIGVHNHPFSSIPSLSDLNAIAKRSNQTMGVIICHDGTVFVYTKPSAEMTDSLYTACLTKYKKYSKMTCEDKGFELMGEKLDFKYRRLEAYA